MDDEEILDIASNLESASDAATAQSQLFAGKPGLWLHGNRDALIRMAAAFLRAAASPIPDNECCGEPSILQHRQICNAKSDYGLTGVQRINEFPENPDVIAARRRRAWHNDRFFFLGCAVVGFAILFLLVSGIMFWWHLFTAAPIR
jgi:hypothetical protein